jgi:hypothetical protein
MRVARTVLPLAVALLASAAAAQHPCQLEGASYPENAVVCSRGIVLNCANGIWQSNQGARCEVANGSYLTPLRPYKPKSDEPIPEFYREKYPWLKLP